MRILRKPRDSPGVAALVALLTRGPVSGTVLPYIYIYIYHVTCDMNMRCIWEKRDMRFK